MFLYWLKPNAYFISLFIFLWLSTKILSSKILFSNENEATYSAFDRKKNGSINLWVHRGAPRGKPSAQYKSLPTWKKKPAL